MISMLTQYFLWGICRGAIANYLSSMYRIVHRCLAPYYGKPSASEYTLNTSIVTTIA